MVYHLPLFLPAIFHLGCDDEYLNVTELTNKLGMYLKYNCPLLVSSAKMGFEMSSVMTHFATSWLKLLRRYQVARSKLVSSWVLPGKKKWCEVGSYRQKKYANNRY